MCADCSGHSPKMSNHERFAQVTHQNRAIMSESLRSLTKNEKMSELLIFSQKTSDCSENRWANSQPWSGKKVKRIWREALFSWSGEKRYNSGYGEKLKWIWREIQVDLTRSSSGSREKLKRIWREALADLERRSSRSGENLKQIWRKALFSWSGEKGFSADLERSAIADWREDQADLERRSSRSGEKIKRIWIEAQADLERSTF